MSAEVEQSAASEAVRRFPTGSFGWIDRRSDFVDGAEWRASRPLGIDREALGPLVDEASATLAQHDRVWANTSSNPLPTSGVSAALRKVIPILAAASAEQTEAN